jgi:hypothetical protein
MDERGRSVEIAGFLEVCVDGVQEGARADEKSLTLGRLTSYLAAAYWGVLRQARRVRTRLLAC